MKTKRTIAMVLAVVVLALTLAGCARRREPVTIWSSDTLRIEREGCTFRIHDLAGGGSYTLGITHIKRTPGITQEVQTARSLVDTETITIETAHKLIIVTDKASGKTLYIRR